MTVLYIFLYFILVYMCSNNGDVSLEKNKTTEESWFHNWQG